MKALSHSKRLLALGVLQCKAQSLAMLGFSHILGWRSGVQLAGGSAHETSLHLGLRLFFQEIVGGPPSVFHDTKFGRLANVPASAAPGMWLLPQNVGETLTLQWGNSLTFSLYPVNDGLPGLLYLTARSW